MSERRFVAGDVVLHRPSGERWLLAADQEGGEVVCAGWPETVAKAGDCELVTAATGVRRLDMIARVAKGCAGEIRGSWARRHLDTLFGEARELRRRETAEGRNPLVTPPFEYRPWRAP